MKRKLVSLILVLMLLSACAACGGDTEHVGRWQLVGAELEGLLTEPDVFGINALLTLQANGTGRLTIDESEEQIRSWSVQGGRITLRTDDETLEGSCADGYIVLTFDDGVSLYFLREGSEAPALELLDREAFEEAYAELVAAGEAMPVD